MIHHKQKQPSPGGNQKGHKKSVTQKDIKTQINPANLAMDLLITTH
jgi:hypothetical protein